MASAFAASLKAALTIAASRHCEYHARVQVPAVEHWLDEGWSPWRIGYGLANLIAMAVTVYVYAREPRHPGAVWWLLATVAIVAVWALGEMLRWRIKYRRLLTSQQKALPEPSPHAIRKLLNDGKRLQADIAHQMSFFGTNCLARRDFPGRIIRWEGEVYEALANKEGIRALIQGAPDLDTNRMISGEAFGRIEYEMKVLQAATDGGTEEFNSDQDAVAKVQSALAAYYAARIMRLQEVCEEGRRIQVALEVNSGVSQIVQRSINQRIDRWCKEVSDVLKYWPDLDKFGYMPDLLDIGQTRQRVQQALEALHIANERLPEAD